ncbi:MAG TPA: glycoside hydrolase domain-containing protein [Burkholderiales bacterium]|nr:glycoside hydrolase domain-containing protein [Burkholderiales bacterium]
MSSRFGTAVIAAATLAVLWHPPLQAGTDGLVLKRAPYCSVWWAPGATKVKRTDPLPVRGSEAVDIQAAKNEYEPYQIVLVPAQAAAAVRVEAGPLRQDSGAEIAAANVAVARVAYVTVKQPTDAYGAAGDWPDPLPPYDGPFAAAAGENSALWITVYVPPTARAGDYRGSVTLSSSDWPAAVVVPVRLHVWDFALPATPSIRSGFGLVVSEIKAYHNLTTREELGKVYRLYLENFRAHRIAPISFAELYPIDVRFSGIPWRGGEFVTAPVHSGRRAFMIADNDPAEAVEARSAGLIPVAAGIPYRLSWWARTEKEGQEYTVFLQALDGGGEPVHRLNLVQVFKGATDWKEERLDVPVYPPEVRTVVVRLFPAFRDERGTFTGTAWFDDVSLAAAAGGPNLVPGGDFEMPAEGMSVETDFGEFDLGARLLLDEFGFNAFDLSVQGLGSGSFYSQKEGLFGGFRQGTPEYDHLLSMHLGQVQAHLAANGWLGKEYIYWFDEPDPKDYPFVREGMLNIRKNASKLTRFITEHRPGPDIMDLSEIGCTIFNRVDPAVIARLAPQGREFWSYLCTGPKGPWVTLFIDHPAVNLRMWLWMSYKFGLKGILVWRANYWSSPTLFPAGVLQNPWQDPMSYTVGYGVPYGQVNHWGNGDGRFLYPPNREPGKDKTKYLAGPVNSIRWEILREGIEDYEYFKLLEKAAATAGARAPRTVREAKALLDLPASLFKSGQEYTKDPHALLAHRAKVASAIEKLAAAK